MNWKYYPLEDYKHATTVSNLQELLANTGLQYQVTKGLNISVRYQYQKQQVTTDNLQDTDSYSTRDLINQFSQIENGTVKYIVPVGSILNRSTTTTETHNIRNQVDYSKNWKGQNITVIAVKK